MAVDKNPRSSQRRRSVRHAALLGVLASASCSDSSSPADEGSTSASPTTTAAETGTPPTTSVDPSLSSSTSAADSTTTTEPGSSSTGPVAEGEFELLTYNVAGLPQGISGSDPERNIPQISPLLDTFPLVLAQEDFWYHAELTADISHPHQSEPYTDNPKREGIGDGLNRFSTFPFEAVERVAWYSCHGQLDCASDCLATKGWSFARTQVDEGVEIDVYNLHMEAGGCPEDLEIRLQASMDLATAIAERSDGRAVLVGGDFNLNREDAEDVEPLDLILDGAGLTDACDSVGCSDERIDKIMFRSGNRVQLGVTAWRVPDEFVDAKTGDPLSDHLPVASVITYGPR